MLTRLRLFLARRLCPRGWEINRWPHATYEDYVRWFRRRKLHGFDAIFVPRYVWDAANRYKDPTDE